MITVPRAVIAVSLVGGIAGSLWGCSDRHDANASIEVSDSAGIEIVSILGSSENVAHWRTETVLTIGQQAGPEEYTFGQIADVDIDHRGRFYVLDRQAQLARVYDRDGQFLFTFGGAGEGPGELSTSALQVRVGPRDSIMVLDGWQMRLNVYGPDGTPARTVMMPVGRPGPVGFQQLGNGRLLVRWFTTNLATDGTFLPWDALLLSDPSQSTFDTVMQFDYRPPSYGRAGAMLLPLIPNAAICDLPSDGSIVWSALSQSQLWVSGLDGAVRRIVRNRRWRLRATTAADREALAAAFRRRMHITDGSLPKNVVFPDSVPTITAVRRGPEPNVWVRRMGPLSEIDPQALAPGEADWLGGRMWEVYDQDGHWQAIAELPSRFHVTRITDSTIVGIQRDSLDVERVMLLRVLR